LALVLRANASEPDEASDSAKEPSVSVASLGSHSRFSSGEAHMENVLLMMVLWMSAITETDGSARASSSMTSSAEVNELPEPSNSSGTSMPMKPWSKTALMSSGVIALASSIACTFGMISFCANCRAASCIIASSSVSDVHGRWYIEEAASSSTAGAF